MRRATAATEPLGEGLAETLTITRLGIAADSALGRAHSSTNPIESMLSLCRERARNVKRWRGRGMVLRWTAARIDAERSCRRVRGFRGLPKLERALRRHAASVDGEREEVKEFPTAAA